MPYQPTNPYPYNTAIDLHDGLQFRFKVDNYDTIESFKIELYDYLKNKKLYTIIRTLGDVQFVSTFQSNQNYYILEINETQKVLTSENKEVQGTVILYKGTDVMFPADGENKDLETFKGTIQGYDADLQKEITKELQRMPNAVSNKKLVQGNSQIIQILDENEEQVLLKEYTNDSALPIKGGLGVKSIGEVDITPYLADIEAIERKKYYGNTESYEQLKITNEECFVLDEKGTIIKYIAENNKTEKPDEIVIPYRTSKGLVKNIGVGVFANNTNIISVVIPSCVTTIDSEAFCNCTNLKEVYLNYGISKINEGCFANCGLLDNINLLDSINFIGQRAFENCTALKDLRLPWSLTQINERTFSNTGIVILDLPINLENIEKQAFYGCEKLITINCNENLKNIREKAFGECKLLIDVNFKLDSQLNSQLIELGDQVFLNCVELEDITIPNNIQKIGYAILQGCEQLSELIVPFIGKENSIEENKRETSVLGYFFGGTEDDNVEGTTKQFYAINISKNYFIPERLNKVIITNTTFVPYGAFSNCVNLRQIIMSDAIIEIQDYAFYNCIKISDIHLSPNTRYIGNYAFALAEQKNLN